MSTRVALSVAVAAALLRCSLVASGVGLRHLTTRIEVSTPANGLLPIKEGVHLLKLGLSPYGGSATHVPPLVLWGMAGVVDRSWMYAVPQIVADLFAALLLRRIMLLAPGAVEQHLGIGPNGIMAAYLFNPFCIMSCVAGTTTPLENLSIMAAVYAACLGSIFSTGAFLALGIYIGLQPHFLVVPLSVLAAQSVSVRSKSNAAHQAARQSSAAQTDKTDAKASGQQQEATEGSLDGGPGLGALAMSCVSIIAAAAFAFLCLLACSDLVLASFPRDQCLPMLMHQISGASRDELANANHHPTDSESPWSHNNAASTNSCWVTHVYGLHLLFKDLTPNIGQWWYFFAEVFPQQRAFFCFVAHAICGMFALPLALRFPSNGRLLVVLQVGMSTMLRPYPSVGDLGLYLSLLPLVHQQLRRIRIGLLLSNSLLLLAVLGPAMWTQWIDAESANSNFFYSITLLLGAWHTLLLLQLLVAAVGSEK